MTDPIDVHVAQTAAEAQQIRDSAADLARFPHVSAIVAHDPDAPDAVIASVNATVDAPCLRHVAKMLREIADQLEAQHPPGECEASAWP